MGQKKGANRVPRAGVHLRHGLPPLSALPERFAGLGHQSIWQRLRVAPSVGSAPCWRVLPLSSGDTSNAWRHLAFVSPFA